MKKKVEIKNNKETREPLNPKRDCSDGVPTDKKRQKERLHQMMLLWNERKKSTEHEEKTNENK